MYSLDAVTVALTVAQFVDKIGRRPLWLISTGGMLCAYILITALSATFDRTQESATGIAVIPFLLYVSFLPWSYPFCLSAS